MLRWILALGLVALGFTDVTLAAAQQAVDARAVEAYRAGDLETAQALWLDLLEDGEHELHGSERARVLYDLGTLAARAHEPLEAVGWFTAALRLRPRDADTWAGLELARLEAELPAADRGDLAATVERLLTSWTPAEASWIAWLGLTPLLVALLFEALRGGRLWRAASALALLVALLSLLPYARVVLLDTPDPVLVIERGGATARSEPRLDAGSVGTLEVGETLERLAEHPGWVQVRLEAGQRGWVRDSSLFALDR